MSGPFGSDASAHSALTPAYDSRSVVPASHCSVFQPATYHPLYCFAAQLEALFALSQWRDPR